MPFLDPETGEYWGFDTALAEDLAEEYIYQNITEELDQAA